MKIFFYFFWKNLREKEKYTCEEKKKTHNQSSTGRVKLFKQKRKNIFKIHFF